MMPCFAASIWVAYFLIVHTLSFSQEKWLSVRYAEQTAVYGVINKFPPSALSESGAWLLPQGRNRCFLSAAVAAPLFLSI